MTAEVSKPGVHELVARRRLCPLCGSELVLAEFRHDRHLELEYDFRGAPTGRVDNGNETIRLDATCESKHRWLARARRDGIGTWAIDSVKLWPE